MVFEDLLTKTSKRKIYSLILGILYVLIAYGTAKTFFTNEIPTATIILTTLLFVPSVSRLFTFEEKIERRDGTRNFFRDHKLIIEVFFFLFIGVLIGYLIVGNIFQDALVMQDELLNQQSALNTEKTSDSWTKASGIMINNIEVIIIAFVVSLFYGAGAFFLLVRTASIFAAYIIMITESLAQKTQAIGAVFLIHFIPEILGFILAAFAGGVISKAIVREKIGTDAFKNVVKDSTMMLIYSICLIVLAALIETYITPNLVAYFVK